MRKLIKSQSDLYNYIERFDVLVHSEWMPEVVGVVIINQSSHINNFVMKSLYDSSNENV